MGFPFALEISFLATTPFRCSNNTSLTQEMRTTPPTSTSAKTATTTMTRKQTCFLLPSAPRSAVDRKESKGEREERAGIAARSDDSGQRLDGRQTSETRQPLLLLWKPENWNHFLDCALTLRSTRIQGRKSAAI